MSKRSSLRAGVRALILPLVLAAPAASEAATINVPAGGDLQAAINAAGPGDTILLEPGATYVGNFRLPVHAGTTYITIRSAAPDTLLPASGVRMTPAYSPYLPKIKSANSVPAMRTDPSAAFWRLQFLEFDANLKGQGDILSLGDGSSAQNTRAQVPHHLIVDRVYLHGDRLNGQKRGIGLNSAQTTIVNSYVADIKAVGQDTQAIASWNGPGPFRIENNYLEASTEVVLFGGDDPKIQDLTASDITVRNNTLTRPVSWRDPIVPAPANVRASFTFDGSLAAGTYGYRVVAQRPAGTATAKSAASTEVTVTTAPGSRVTLTWDPVPDATSYIVYGRTPGAPAVYWTVTTPAFVDGGTSNGTAGTPAKGTVWQVKNVFELKNAQRVQVDHNIFENNWLQAQNGYAILFTPRNQYGACTWCVVQDVVFEDNVVRHVGAAVNLLGQDYLRPTRQTNNITIRNNEFSDVSKAWGGSGYFLSVSDQPGKVVIDHNTIISPDGGGIITVSGDPVSGFEFTNNVARHNTYGIFGANLGTGLASIDAYFPGAVIARNVFAGGKASKYPAGNEFPTTVDFETHFTDYTGADYSLRPDTNWARTGTDGADLGAAMSDLRASLSGADADPPQVVTTALPATTEFDSYNASLVAAGGTAPFQWRVLAGQLPAGLSLDQASGAIRGSATLEGNYPFTIEAADATGTTAAQPLSVHVDRYIPPVSIVTGDLPNAVATLPYGQALQAAGGLGTYRWMLTGGTLPAGLSFSDAGVIAGTPAQRGTTMATVTAYDAADATRSASRTLTIVVDRPPNQPPVVWVTAPDSAVRVGSTMTLAATATDADGVVARVDYYVDGVPVGTTVAAPFLLDWQVPTSGSHRFSAVAMDDEGAVAASNEVTIQTNAEIVLRSSDVSKLVGNYQVVADATAAGGHRVWNPNKGAAKLAAALAAPANYVELTFCAEAGTPYHLWIRGKAENNTWANDSAFVQFDHVADSAIGTTSSQTYSLEDDVNLGVAGWGWQDNGYGADVTGAAIVFTTTGLQTIRIQPREDGLSFDQIVLSPSQYFTAAPGPMKNDATILAK